MSSDLRDGQVCRVTRSEDRGPVWTEVASLAVSQAIDFVIDMTLSSYPWQSGKMQV